ncbi:putative mediator of RNA polymerase II transcription subunit 26 [Drosophila serrata]|uniref:putative mediator of RNA polymerase II transcription subunit 26 n=1 Tax=Drosophila serrata TaxID=7274 RepID=UPI000A1D222E|nr:putative mediator of RNA polymerase II transcription subunit 26 [Drosophila serrata]
MFWTAVASSTLTSERSAGLASAAPNYQQQHTKPLLRPTGSSWQLSNAAFKSRQQQQQLMQQYQKQIRQQEEEALQQEQLSLDQIARVDGQTKKEPKDVKKKKQQPVANCKKKISLKGECKIFKAFTSCKCTQK